MVARMVIRIGAGDAGGAAAAGQDGGEPVRAGQGEAAARVASFIYYITLYYIVVKTAANLCELAKARPPRVLYHLYIILYYIILYYIMLSSRGRRTCASWQMYCIVIKTATEYPS